MADELEEDWADLKASPPEPAKGKKVKKEPSDPTLTESMVRGDLVRPGDIYLGEDKEFEVVMVSIPPGNNSNISIRGKDNEVVTTSRYGWLSIRRQEETAPPPAWKKGDFVQLYNGRQHRFLEVQEVYGTKDGYYHFKVESEGDVFIANIHRPVRRRMLGGV